MNEPITCIVCELERIKDQAEHDLKILEMSMTPDEEGPCCETHMREIETFEKNSGFLFASKDMKRKGEPMKTYKRIRKEIWVFPELPNLDESIWVRTAKGVFRAKFSKFDWTDQCDQTYFKFEEDREDNVMEWWRDE